MTLGVAIELDYLGLRVNILYQIKIYSGNKTRGPKYTVARIVRIHPVAFKGIVSVSYKSGARVRMQLWNNTLPERLRLQKTAGFGDVGCYLLRAIYTFVCSFSLFSHHVQPHTVYLKTMTRDMWCHLVFQFVLVLVTRMI